MCSDDMAMRRLCAKALVGILRRPCRGACYKSNRWTGAYRMRLVGSSRKMDHAVEARKRGAIALVAVAIKLLLREDVSTALDRHSKLPMHLQGEGSRITVGRGCKYGDHVPRRRTTP
jgi:hypothetical protein